MYLSKEAGGVGGAIKAMMGSMMGPMGIMVAVSLVTSLAVAFGDKLFGATEKAQESTKEYIGDVLSLTEKLHRLGKVSDEQMKNTYEQQIKIIDTQLAQTKQIQVAVGQHWVASAMGRGGAMVTDYETRTVSTKTDEERMKMLNERADLLLKIQGINKEISKEENSQSKIEEKKRDAVRKHNEEVSKGYDENTKFLNDEVSMLDDAYNAHLITYD